MDNHSTSPPPTPPIPARTSLKPIYVSPGQRSPAVEISHRQPSLPPKPRPASPEVISSLISSLSAISSPAEHHFAKLPKMDGSPSPYAPPTAHDGDSPLFTESGGFAYKKDPFRSASIQDDQSMNHSYHDGMNHAPDKESFSSFDAAAAPVVRLTRAPAALPSLSEGREPTSPRLAYPKSHQSLRPGEVRPGVGMSQAMQNTRSSSTSSASSSKNPTRRSSNESTTGFDPKRARMNDDRVEMRSQGPGVSDAAVGRAVLPFSNRSVAVDRIDESSDEYDLLQSPTAPLQESMINPSPIRPEETGSPGGIGAGHFVPSRRSSLRHSPGGTSPTVNPSRSHSRHSSTVSKDRKGDHVIREEGDPTVRRIRELQEAKDRREKEMQREAGRMERSRSYNSLPSPILTQRRASRQSSRHSVGDITHPTVDQFPDPNESAPSPTISMNKGTARRAAAPSTTTTATTAYGGTTLRIASPNTVGDSRDSSRARYSPRPTSPSRTFSGSQLPPSGNSSSRDRAASADSIDQAVEDYISSPRLTQQVRHPHTGRVIAFSEVGDPDGFAVICCVGMGLTRYLSCFYEELAKTLKLRLITPDRPGVGESEPCLDGTGTPMNWPDDVAIICNRLGITKFSLLAHSAGAIYAFATALRLPQHVRGRLHVMAAWIPPSQLSVIGTSHQETVPANNVPYSQKLLRILPTSFLKAANSSFLSTTSASISTKSPGGRFRKKGAASPAADVAHIGGDSNGSGKQLPSLQTRTASPSTNGQTSPFYDAPSNIATSNVGDFVAIATRRDSAFLTSSTMARQSTYDDRLTHAIWNLATTNANPAIDLVICLERKQRIGFRYVDITRSVVLHHGSRDTRVPVENIRWLGKMMRRCEVRVLEGEGHGLMASATVMSSILSEVAKEWEEWKTVTQGNEQKRRS